MLSAPPAITIQAPTSGVIVSTRHGSGHLWTGDFASDDVAVQYAYDHMVTDPALPKTLILDCPDRPFAFAGPLDIWQSSCRVTSTGGLTIGPAPGYTGALITSGLRPETRRGEDGLIANVVIDHLWLNGDNRCLGIKLRDLQLSTLHNLHIRRTDGPGLWLSDCCIENLFAQIVLSDECGNQDLPALLIRPESAARAGIADQNITVNSTSFNGIMIHFPTNDAMRIENPHTATPQAHRKIQFTGCFFHAHGRHSRPLVTIHDSWELTIVGTQMLCWSEEGAVIQLGGVGNRIPIGASLISHCIFGSRPGSRCVGIHLVDARTDGPALALFGNAFGSFDRRLRHAVDWGQTPGISASWAGNTVHVSGQPHLGVTPRDADCSPFTEGEATSSG